MAIQPIVFVFTIWSCLHFVSVLGASDQNQQQLRSDECPADTSCSNNDIETSEHVENAEKLSLFRIPYDLKSIDRDVLLESIFNVGFLKLEISEEMKPLVVEVENTLKEWYETLDYGKNMSEELIMSPYWFPKRQTFFGYIAHYNNTPPMQIEQFCVPKHMMRHPLNPFLNMNNVMKFLEYMLQENWRIMQEIWWKVGLYSDDDLNTIVYGGKNKENENAEMQPAVMCVAYYNPKTLTDFNKTIDIGIRRHFDTGLLTLSIQDREGLEVQKGINDNDEWIRIDDTDCNETFILNFGGVMRVTTNGKFKAGEHRVLPIPDTPRLSIVIFQDAPYDGNVYKYDENDILMPHMTYQEYLTKALAVGYGQKNDFLDNNDDNLPTDD